MFNKEFNFQNIFKQESRKIGDTHFLPSKNVSSFLQTKQESIKITVARKG